VKLRPPLRSVLDTMAAEGLVDLRDREALRNAAPAFAGGPAIPWYLHAVMIAVAWVAAPCIAAAPLSQIDSDAAHVVIGLLGCTGLCVARRHLLHPLAAHFMLAFSVVFQVVAVVGFLEVCDADSIAGLLSALLFGTLFVAYADPVHRVVMVLGAMFATVLTAVDADLPLVLEVHAVVALAVVAALWGPATPKMLGRSGALVRPAALGLLVAGLVCAALCGTEFLRHELGNELEHELQPLAASVPLWVGLFSVVALRLHQHGVRLTARSAVVSSIGIVVLVAMAYDRPLLPAALLALVLAFHARDVIGVSFALLALVWETVFLWVATDVEALPRAFSILTTGIVLLGAWWMLKRHAAGGGARARP